MNFSWVKIKGRVPEIVKEYLWGILNFRVNINFFKMVPFHWLVGYMGKYRFIQLGGTLSVGCWEGFERGNIGSLGGSWGALICLVYTCNSLFLSLPLYSSSIFLIISILALLEDSFFPSSSSFGVMLRHSLGDIENMTYMVSINFIWLDLPLLFLGNSCSQCVSPQSKHKGVSSWSIAL